MGVSMKAGCLEFLSRKVILPEVVIMSLIVCKNRKEKNKTFNDNNKWTEITSLCHAFLLDDTWDIMIL